MDTALILNQLQSLISDCSQVVSYKWISRNFSVSYNAAKRLLHEFVGSLGTDIEVVYCVSGWTQSDPKCYTTVLVKKDKLEETKANLNDSSSYIYSVQAFIPKDLALLWNAEFLEGEEAFNHSLIAGNCIKDNSYSAVSYSLVQCNLKQQSERVVPSIPENGAVKVNESNKKVPVQEKLVKSNPLVKGSEQTSVPVKEVSSGKIANASDNIKTSMPSGVTNKDKAGKTAGGSLASLWGRASTKPKSTSASLAGNANKIPINPTSGNQVTLNSDAQIKAWEAADDVSSEDEAFMKRGNQFSSKSARKRRVILDASDDEQEDLFAGDNVTRLASPENPVAAPSANSDMAENNKSTTEGIVSETENINGKSKTISNNHSTKTLTCDDGDFELINGKDKSKSLFISGSTSSSKRDLPKGQTNGQSGKDANKSTNAKMDKNSSFKENVSDCQNNTCSSEKRPCDDKAVTNGIAKKRKVLKTCIDERGREVTQVMWETDGPEPEPEPEPGKAEQVTNFKEIPSVGQINKNQGVAKAQSLELSHPAKPVAKNSQKGGAKDSRQGNILSFFKKQ